MWLHQETFFSVQLNRVFLVWANVQSERLSDPELGPELSDGVSLFTALFLFEEKSCLWNAEVDLVLTPAPVCCSLFAFPKDTKDSVAPVTVLLFALSSTAVHLYHPLGYSRCYLGGNSGGVCVSVD